MLHTERREPLECMAQTLAAKAPQVSQCRAAAELTCEVPYMPTATRQAPSAPTIFLAGHGQRQKTEPCWPISGQIGSSPSCCAEASDGAIY